MNDNERELWVNNDEYLYRLFETWKRRNKGGMRGFLKEHRTTIDEIATPTRASQSELIDGYKRHLYG